MDHEANPQNHISGVVAGLLSILRLLTEGFALIYGAPSALATGGDLYGKMRERALRWLHDMESVARRLLLLRATQYPAPPVFVPNQGHPNITRAKEGDEVSLFGPAEDSAQWSVRFRITAPHGSAAFDYDLHAFREPKPRRYRAGRSMGKIFWADDPRPLAERFEALLRVLNDPESHAARLALRLYRWRGQRERLSGLLHSLCAGTPISNEAKLDEALWQEFAAARDSALALLPVFSCPATLNLDSG